MSDDRWPATSPSDDGRNAEAVREFADAIRAYRQASGRTFPTWDEILRVLHGLGYRKVSEGDDKPDPLPRSGQGPSSEDP